VRHDLFRHKLALTVHREPGKAYGPSRIDACKLEVGRIDACKLEVGRIDACQPEVES
jgi:hypothetical protein